MTQAPPSPVYIPPHPVQGKPVLPPITAFFSPSIDVVRDRDHIIDISETIDAAKLNYERGTSFLSGPEPYIMKVQQV